MFPWRRAFVARKAETVTQCLQRSIVPGVFPEGEVREVKVSGIRFRLRIPRAARFEDVVELSHSKRLVQSIWSSGDC